MPSESRPLFASDLLEFLVDPGSFEPWDADIPPLDPLTFRYRDGSSHGDRLVEIKRDLGVTSEAILTGSARVHGFEIALVISDFRFMGGSIGVVAGEKLVRAFERARGSSIPVVSFVASGGVRLQEGCVAFLQMINVAMGAKRLREAGMLHVVFLGDPTTGGALASWGSLGTLTFAAPGARIGFAGPRLIEALGGQPPPPQTAEDLHRWGLIDDVVPPAEMRERLIRILSVVEARVSPPGGPEDQGEEAIPEPREARAADPWTTVENSRDPLRPGSWDVLLSCGSDLTFVEARRSEGEADGIIAAVGRICGVSAVFLGHDRRQNQPGGVVAASGLRKAQRAIEVAQELDLPLVTVIDTPGAQLSRSAEAGGLSPHIAETIVRMSTLDTPTLAVILGEGGGGAALALFPADRVLAAENSWLAPISPEGGSSILWKTPDYAAVLTRHQRITAKELEHMGVVDRVVAEYPSAAAEREPFLARLGAAIDSELRALISEDAASRLESRERRYRHVGAS